MYRITNWPLTFSNLPTALYIIINNVGHWPILLSHVHHSIMHSRALDPSHSSNQTECPEQNLSTASWVPLINILTKRTYKLVSVFPYSEQGLSKNGCQGYLAPMEFLESNVWTLGILAIGTPTVSNSQLKPCCDGRGGCQGAQDGVYYSFPYHTLQPERSCFLKNDNSS